MLFFCCGSVVRRIHSFSGNMLFFCCSSAARRIHRFSGEFPFLRRKIHSPENPPFFRRIVVSPPENPQPGRSTLFPENCRFSAGKSTARRIHRFSGELPFLRRKSTARRIHRFPENCRFSAEDPQLGESTVFPENSRFSAGKSTARKIHRFSGELPFLRRKIHNPENPLFFRRIAVSPLLNLPFQNFLPAFKYRDLSLGN